MDLIEGFWNIHVRQRDVRDNTIKARSGKRQLFGRRTDEGPLGEIAVSPGYGRVLGIDPNNVPGLWKAEFLGCQPVATTKIENTHECNSKISTKQTTNHRPA